MWSCERCGGPTIPLFTGFACKAECDLRASRETDPALGLLLTTDNGKRYERVWLNGGSAGPAWHPILDRVEFKELRGRWFADHMEDSYLSKALSSSTPMTGSWPVDSRYDSLVDLRECLGDWPQLHLLLYWRLS